jgi:hypothetical protein
VADPDEAEGSRGDGGSAGAQIRTFLIADVRGYTLFTQERGDEAAAKLATKFADIALSDDAAQAPLTIGITTHANSERAENVRVQPRWGMPLSLIWVQ